MDISPTGYWIGPPPENHFDVELCRAIYELFKAKRVYSFVDMGCGRGDYLAWIRNENPCINGVGIEGNPEYQGRNLIWTRDLSLPLESFHRSWVLSLEVGEHLPQAFEGVFLDNVAKASRRGCILSWAVPGQGGIGHVNCQANSYIVKQMAKRGFVLDSDSTRFLRDRSTLPWFEQTLMVFRRLVRD